MKLKVYILVGVLIFAIILAGFFVWKTKEVQDQVDKLERQFQTKQEEIDNLQEQIKQLTGKEGLLKEINKTYEIEAYDLDYNKTIIPMEIASVEKAEELKGEYEYQSKIKPKTDIFIIVNVGLTNDTSKTWWTRPVVRLIDKEGKKYAPFAGSTGKPISPGSFKRERIIFLVPREILSQFSLLLIDVYSKEHRIQVSP